MRKIYMAGAMKGGVGKSVMVFNLAYSLQGMGKRFWLWTLIHSPT